MTADLSSLVDHTGDDDCTVCTAQDIVASILVPAVAAWEATQSLPRFSLAIQGAAGLLGAMLEDGLSRHDIEEALGRALDDVEQRIAEDQSFGGPPQGTA
jgi:hypothetical protein